MRSCIQCQELHALIVALACEGDSAPARSLMRISRRWNDVARPYRFFAVSISSIPSISSLRDALLAAASNERRLYKLAISVPESVSSSEGDAEDVLLKLIRGVVLLAAPTLDSLTLSVKTYYTPNALWNVRDEAGAVWDDAVLLPVLKRLHVSGNCNPSGLFLYDTLVHICPQLEELSISGICCAPSLAIEVEVALRVFDSDPEIEPIVGAIDVSRAYYRELYANARFPPSLKRLIVISIVPRDDDASFEFYDLGEMEKARIDHGWMVSILRAACRSCEADTSMLHFNLKEL